VSTPFENNYNGGGNTIKGYNIQINVGTNSDLEETGIFGRTLGATLSNIHFVGDGSTSTIKGTFTGKTSYKCIVLGGIVGYLKNSTLTNSSISGYNVVIQYTGSQQQGEYAVVAGLVGASAGTITNCSAVNKKVSLETTTLAQLSEQDIRISIAGICGNVAKDSGMNNCYAGGSLSFNNSSTNGAYAYISGIANGVNTYLYSKGTHTIKNCYSYCDITTNYAKAYTFGGCPTSSEHPSNDTNSICTTENCYYLKASAAYKYNGATAKTYAEMEALADTKAASSFPWTTTLTGTYPFKAVVKDASDAYVHYGDWPEKPAGPSGLIGLVRKHDPYSMATSGYSTHYDVCYIKLQDGKIVEAYNANNLKSIPSYAKTVKFSGNYKLAAFWDLPEGVTVEYKTGSAISSYRTTSGQTGSTYHYLADDGMTQSLILRVNGVELRDSNAFIIDGGHQFK